jgi:site-specific recombinase XerD
VCDERCRPHQCRPAEAVTVAQIHAIIKGAFGYAVRWKWIEENPAVSATPPEVAAEHADPLSPDEAVRLLAAAGEQGSPRVSLDATAALEERDARERRQPVHQLVLEGRVAGL